MDCFEGAKILTNKHLELMQANLKCIRAAIQELLSIVKYNGVENRVISSSQCGSAVEKQHLTTPTESCMLALTDPHITQLVQGL